MQAQNPGRIEYYHRVEFDILWPTFQQSLAIPFEATANIL